MITKILIAVFVFPLLCSSVFAIHDTLPAETQITLPGPDATALYAHITKSDPYRSWQFWPGKGKLYKGTEPHGALLTTYINRTAFESVRQKTVMADASIIVKENYTHDAKFTALSVMYKIRGYHPSKGDWFWVQYSPEGNVEASGRVEACIACHEKRKDHDYLYSGSLR